MKDNILYKNDAVYFLNSTIELTMNLVLKLFFLIFIF